MIDVEEENFPRESKYQQHADMPTRGSSELKQALSLKRGSHHGKECVDKMLTCWHAYLK